MGPEPRGPGIGLVELEDEREPLARAGLELLRDSFPPSERQPPEQIAMEIAEKRLGLLTSYDFHMIVATRGGEEVLGLSAGVYLGGVNAGFVTYLAVREGVRGHRIGERLRVRLIELFRADARALEREELAWVVGEVRAANPWLRRLVRRRAAIPFDLDYFHPGVSPEDDERWLLYRQPVADTRPEIPAAEVRRLLYAIWRRAYRVRWPLERDGFLAMLAELDSREAVGCHPAFRAGGGADGVAGR